MSHGTRAGGSTCRTCGEPIEWAKTAAGKWMPLNPEPSPGKTVAVGQPGNVVVREGVAYVLSVGKSIEDDEVMRVPHFATCAKRKALRRAPTVSREFFDHCILGVEASTSTPGGGETTHGGRTTIVLQDEGGTCIRAVNGSSRLGDFRLTIEAEGDAEARVLAQAFSGWGKN